MMLAALIPAAVQLGTSIYQGVQAKKLSETEDPTYKIPESAKRALELQAQLAGNKEFAGQTLIEDKLRQSTATGANQISQMGGGAAGMGAVLDLYGKQQNSLVDVAIQSEGNWERRQRDLANSLNTMATWENNRNQWERDKYLSAQQQSSDMKAGAIHNLYGASKTGSDYIIQNEYNNTVRNNTDGYMKLIKTILDAASKGEIDKNNIDPKKFNSSGGEGTINYFPNNPLIQNSEIINV